jgi:hypothetical protein
MNCWRIRIYFTKSRFSLNGSFQLIWSYCQDMKKIITKSGILLNAGTLNQGFTVLGKLGSIKKNLTEIEWKVAE